jgi:transcription antitermination factor NusG
MPLLRREIDAFPQDLFRLPDEAWPWVVASVRSRQEKVLARQLAAHHVPYYLPVGERRSTISGRRRVSYLPLFPGYVFFRGREEARRVAFASRVIVRLLPIADPDRLHAELFQLKRLQDAGAMMTPFVALSVGEAVRIVEGPFRGYSGVIVRETSCLRLLVSVSMLQRAVAVELPREAIARAGVPSREGGARTAVA